MTEGDTYATLYRRNLDGATVEIRPHGTRGPDFLFARALGKKTWHSFHWDVFSDWHKPVAGGTGPQGLEMVK